jgi:hypothetical protein
MSGEYAKYAGQAQSGTLAADFDQWDLANGAGWTVAHEAAQWGNLPADFDQWDSADYIGVTVAHSAAVFGNLPISFGRWGLVNNKGISVLRLYLDKAASRRFVDDWSTKVIRKWAVEKPLCETEADWEVFKTELPEIYSKHSILENMHNGTAADIPTL